MFVFMWGVKMYEWMYMSVGAWRSHTRMPIFPLTSITESETNPAATKPQ